MLIIYSRGAPADSLNRGEKQADKDSDDPDDHEQFDESEAPTSGSTHLNRRANSGGGIFSISAHARFSSVFDDRQPDFDMSLYRRHFTIHAHSNGCFVSFLAMISSILGSPRMALLMACLVAS